MPYCSLTRKAMCAPTSATISSSDRTTSHRHRLAWPRANHARCSALDWLPIERADYRGEGAHELQQAAGARAARAGAAGAREAGRRRGRERAHGSRGVVPGDRLRDTAFPTPTQFPQLGAPPKRPNMVLLAKRKNP